MPTAPIRKPDEIFIPLILFLLLASIYLGFLTKNYYWDGIAFAQAIEGAPRLHPSLVHPNHLLYNLVGHVFYHSLRWMGFNLRAVTALQILNSLLSAWTAVLLFRILMKTLQSVYLAVTLTLLFAFSATWWKYSTDADAYVPGVLLLLLSFYFVFPPQKPRPVLVGLIYAFSILLHQMAVLSFPVLAAAIFIQDSALVRRHRLINVLCFSAISVGLTLGAYLYSFYLLTGGVNPEAFVRWSLSYAPDDSFGFRPLINLGFTVRGHWRLFFGGRFNAIYGLINPFIVLLMALWVGLFLTFIYKVFRSLKNPGSEWLRALRRDPESWQVAKICVLWICTYLIGLFIFVAHHTYYRMFYLPALIILLGLGLNFYQKTAGSSRQYRLAIFVALLVIANFLMVIFPGTYVWKYPPLDLALQMNQVWPRNTIIYFGYDNSDINLVKYFNQGTEWKKLNIQQSEKLEEELRDAKSRGVMTWLDTSAINELAKNEEGQAWLQRHSIAGSQRALITKAHNIRFVQIVPGA